MLNETINRVKDRENQRRWNDITETIVWGKGYFRTQRVRHEYSEWIQQYHWDYFLTSTFRATRKDPYYALKYVWKECEKSYARRGFLVSEPFQSGDVHIHGLVSGWGAGWKPEIELPWELWSRLFKRFGRATVGECNNRGAVASYCSKYLLKQQSRVCDYYEVFGTSEVWEVGQVVNPGGYAVDN